MLYACPKLSTHIYLTSLVCESAQVEAAGAQLQVSSPDRGIASAILYGRAFSRDRLNYSC